jgi:hypothetical protein
MPLIEAVARNFEPAEGHNNWDYVFNCSTEDRYGEVDQVNSVDHYRRWYKQSYNYITCL